MKNKTLHFLNIALIAFIMTLILQVFFTPKDNKIPEEQVMLSIKKEGVVIPNIPEIAIHNTTQSGMVIEPCRDISIVINSLPLTGFASGAETAAFCEPIHVEAHTVTPLVLMPLHKIFAQYPGKYMLTLTTPLGDRFQTFTIEQPGMFRSFFSMTVYQPIYNLFVAIVTFFPGHPLGWAIIIITLILRLLLLFPQHRLLENSRKMNLLNPKIQALRKEYAHDKAQQGMKMMELYKKEKINPIGSCLPVLIQMPILIGLYWVIIGVSEPTNFYHLYSFFSTFDPTTIDTYFFGHNLAGIGGVIGIFACIILGFTQWLQAYLSFKINAPKKTKVVVQEEESAQVAMLDPQAMQKMMLYVFPLIIMMTAYFFPLGVSLYWFIGTLFIIVQQWYVNKLLDKKYKKGEIIPKDQVPKSPAA